jgi:anti-anti-sigma regulatory factor
MVIRVNGRGTSVTSATFERLVADGLREGNESVVVDLTDCEFLDTTFLGCLVTMHRRSLDLPGDPFVIIAPAATRARLFHTAHLDRVLRFVEQSEPLIGEMVAVEISEAGRHELGRHVAQAHRALASLGGGEAGEFKEIADSVERDLDQPDG